MYESAKADSSEEGRGEGEEKDSDKKSKKSDKDEPVEGEVVDDKEEKKE